MDMQKTLLAACVLSFGSLIFILFTFPFNILFFPKAQIYRSQAQANHQIPIATYLKGSKSTPSKTTITFINQHQPQISRVLTKSKPQAFAEQELQNRKSVPKHKKVANERFSPRLKKPHQTSDIIRNKQGSFVRPPPSPTRD